MGASQLHISEMLTVVGPKVMRKITSSCRNYILKCQSIDNKT